MIASLWIRLLIKALPLTNALCFRQRLEYLRHEYQYNNVDRPGRPSQALKWRRLERKRRRGGEQDQVNYAHSFNHGQHNNNRGRWFLTQLHHVAMVANFRGDSKDQAPPTRLLKRLFTNFSSRCAMPNHVLLTLAPKFPGNTGIFNAYLAHKKKEREKKSWRQMDVYIARVSKQFIV